MFRVAAAALVAAVNAHGAGFPKVTLGSLDGKAGVAVIELNLSMSLAYDFSGAGLWMAWQGTAKNAAAADLPAGPAPRAADGRGAARLLSDGPAFHTRRAGQPWSARKGTKPLPVTSTLRAATMEDGLPKITYALRIGSDSVRVEEYPEFDDHYGAKALFRYFVFTGMPAGVTLRLDLRGRAPREGEKPKFTEVGPDSLVQTGNGKTRVKISWPELAWGAGW
jgi:hypothetical protein